MLILTIAGIILLIDQLTKYYVQMNMPLGESIPIINNIFYLTYTKNPGVAFSLLARGDAFLKNIFFLAISLATIVFLIVYLQRGIEIRPWVRVALALVLGGALGNLVDRLRLGCVIDFLDFRIWPVFNLADSAITIGIVTLVYFLLFQGKVESS